jgi:hypothetical protein
MNIMVIERSGGDFGVAAMVDTVSFRARKFNSLRSNEKYLGSKYRYDSHWIDH